MKKLVVLALLCACGSPAHQVDSGQSVTPPEPVVDWDAVPPITVQEGDPTYDPREEVGIPTTTLPLMPPQAPLGSPEPEERETAHQMHMRQTMDDYRPGWCSRFCSRLGGRQLHPTAFRQRLRGDFAMYAEMDSRRFLSLEEEETYEEFTERVAVETEARFGDTPICACEAEGIQGHWVLAVPRERAVFYDMDL